LKNYGQNNSLQRISSRIRVSFPYNKDYVAKIKTIDGYKWHPEGKQPKFL